MKRKFALSLLTVVALACAFLTYIPSVSSNSSKQHSAFLQNGSKASNLMPLLVTTFDVDRTDDTAAATACTVAPNDCSLRGAIIAANTDAGADPVQINLQPATTYNLTLANATQENAAATGDLDITTTLALSDHYRWRVIRTQYDHHRCRWIDFRQHAGPRVPNHRTECQRRLRGSGHSEWPGGRRRCERCEHQPGIAKFHARWWLYP